MKTISTLSYIALATLTMVLPLMAQSATPVSHPKLDKRLTMIAAAVDRHEETPLMNSALARQVMHSNSPLDARWNAEGQVQVYLHYDRHNPPPNIEDLQNLGAKDIQTSPQLGVIQAWLPAASLDAVADVARVMRVSVPRYAMVKRAPVVGPVTYKGSVTTEGDQILKAAQFRSASSYTGQGITLGVISDGDDHFGDSQSSGDLPASIWNDPKDAGGSGGFSPKSSGDEGTAMMEIIYDLAPGVKQLGFCGPQTSVDFITCLDDFANKIHATVIVDDLGYPGGAMFTTDTFTNAVQSFATAHPGIQLVTAAGNDGVAYWQGTWSSPAPVAVSQTVNSVTYTKALNFGSSGSPNTHLTLTVAPGDAIDYVVEWDDPWDDSSTTNDPNDYDVVLFNSFNAPIACNQGININPSNGSCTFPSPKQPLNTPGPTPVQGARWQNTTSNNATVHLEVFRVAGTPGDRIKIVIFNELSHEVIVNPSTPGSIYGHAALPYPTEISAGAIYAPSALSGVYDIEQYSSQGPVETGVTGTTPQSIMKPDFAAPDCVSVTGAGGFGTRFCGTSAAAPHIAALVALLQSAYKNPDPENLLAAGAVQPGSGNPNGVYGFGVPDMQAVLAGNIPRPRAIIDAVNPPTLVSTVKPGSKVTFTGGCDYEGTTSGTTLDWSFGSGSGIPDSNLDSPTVTFNKLGSFPVTLTCADPFGSGTASATLVVATPPVASITSPPSDLSVQVNSQVSFSGVCEFGAALGRVSWSFDNKSGVRGSQQLNPTVVFKRTGGFTVTLSCSDAIGQSMASVKVTVTPAPSTGGGGGATDLLSLMLLGIFAALGRRRVH